MQQHTFYRIINIIIMPVSVLIALQVTGSLPVAFTNPPLLLMEFAFACVPIYAFTANYFYNKSIRKGEQSKISLKEWIKANAVVSAIFSVFLVFVSLGIMAFLKNQQLFDEAWAGFPAELTSQITKNDFRQKAQVLCYVLLPFSILLFIHIIITFGLLNKYKNRFGFLPENPQ